MSSLPFIVRKEVEVGMPTVAESHAPDNPYAVVFEDDGETGYFYALDLRVEDDPIQDALHIYTCDLIKEQRQENILLIKWSTDSTKAMLLVNNYPHAIFDFAARQGYCRTGLPPRSVRGWSKAGHAWSDEAEEHFGLTH